MLSGVSLTEFRGGGRSIKAAYLHTLGVASRAVYEAEFAAWLREVLAAEELAPGSLTPLIYVATFNAHHL